VDRKALPAPDLQAESRAYVPPANPTQTALVEIWQSALGLPRVGVEDNFFELGGHSLTATQVVSRIRESLQVELPLRHVFEQPTIAALAEVISTLPKLEVVRLPEEVDEMSEDQVDAMLRELIAGRAVSE
jgi:acyl carrier protein